MKNIKKVGEMGLIALVQEGNENAFDELYQRYHKLVYYVAFKMCQNDADAQDVAQETFIEIKRSIKSLQKPSFFKLWMYRIVNSKCKKLFRKNKFALTELEKDSVQFAFLEERKDFVPNKDVHYQSDSNVLHTFIDALPEGQRMAVILFYMEQMTSAEIAKVCDVSEGTIKSRLFTARNTLKKNIEDYEHREGISLDFHDLSSALTVCFATQLAIAGGIGVPSIKLKKSTFHNSIADFVHANTFLVKATVIACVSTAVVSGAYVGYQSLQQDNENLVKNQYQTTFPTIEHRGEKISNPKDAYYTLKMNYCKQDVSNLDSAEKTELKKLYQALQTENGVYFKRLQESGWLFDL